MRNEEVRSVFFQGDDFWAEFWMGQFREINHREGTTHFRIGPSRLSVNPHERFYLSKLQPDSDPTSDSYYCILGFKDTHSAVGPACLVLFYILPSTAYSAMSFGLNYLVKKRKRESVILRKDQSVSTQHSSDKYDKYYLDVIKYGFRDAGEI